MEIILTLKLYRNLLYDVLSREKQNGRIVDVEITQALNFLGEIIMDKICKSCGMPMRKAEVFNGNNAGLAPSM